MRIDWYEVKYFFRSLFWKRTYRFLWQKITRGWTDQITWSLDYEMAKWALPRLKRFKELNNGYPGEITWERWNEILDEIIWSLDYIVNYGESKFFKSCNEETRHEDLKKLEKRCADGLRLFGEYFRALWW